VRALAIADSDSYVKWGAATLDRLPPDWEKDLVVLRTPVLPSAGQLSSALVGTSLAGGDARVLDLAGIAALVRREAPDVVLLSARGPAVRVIVRAIAPPRRPRPVLVSGMPGIALPAKRKALFFRSQVDLIVLHSFRELAAFRQRALDVGVEQAFALSTLAFLTPDGERSADPGDIVFASQAKVPSKREARLRLLGWLAAAAEAHPDSQVVVKLRARVGEQQTHAEAFPLDVLAEGVVAPDNLVFATGSMARYLDSARALVTVSSTAVLEAVARGIPALVLDDFGVNDTLINAVFEGSGLLGSSDDLIAGRFREVEPAWAHDNYFHDPSENTLVAELEALLARRATSAFPLRTEARPSLGGRFRHVWDRRQVLGSDDRTVAGAVALVVGTPLRALARRYRAVKRDARARAVSGTAPIA
jgi:hypothetical protein